MSERDTAPTALDELLLRRATEGLSHAEEIQLDELLAASPDEEDSGYEMAAAAVLLGALTETEPMPEHLRQRIAAGAPGRRDADR